MIWVCPVPLFGLAVDSRLAAIDQNKLFWSLISTKLQCNKYQTGDQNKLFWSKISAVSLTAWLSLGCNKPSAAVWLRSGSHPFGSGVSAGRAVVVMVKRGNDLTARYNNLPISCVESQ